MDCSCGCPDCPDPCRCSELAERLDALQPESVSLGIEDSNGWAHDEGVRNF